LTFLAVGNLLERFRRVAQDGRRIPDHRGARNEAPPIDVEEQRAVGPRGVRALEGEAQRVGVALDRILRADVTLVTLIDERLVADRGERAGDQARKLFGVELVECERREQQACEDNHRSSLLGPAVAILMDVMTR
jgi:hypothetical protein